MQSTAGVTGLKGTALALQRARLQLLRLAGLDGQPGAARPQVPAGAQLGDRPAEDRRRRLLRPGRRRARRSSCRTPSYHWEPAADQAYKYDPEETKTQLDLAGYQDKNGDGFRETKDGKPLSLRLLVTNDSPENQTAAKLIAGWFKDVGLKVNLKIVDAGVLLDAQYNYKGDTYAPDYDMYIWFWTYDVDPEMMLGVPTPQQIEGWNDTLWTDPEYTKLFTQQEQTIDVEKRIPLVQRMQEIVWQSSPYLIFAYPYQLEAYRSDKWEGVVPSPSDYEGYDGAAFYNYMNVDTYKQVQPKVATAATSDTGANTTVLVIVGVVVVGDRHRAHHLDGGAAARPLGGSLTRRPRGRRPQMDLTRARARGGGEAKGLAAAPRAAAAVPRPSARMDA